MNNKKSKSSNYKLKYFFKYTLWTPFHWIRNYFFCLRYPFWKSRNVWTDKFMGYGHTLYDEIPEGWRKAFGKQLSRDLKKALIKDGYLKEFRFSYIKVKWGELCLYNFGVGKESDKVIRKYELMSRGYCINCGKPTRYVTSGWVSYLCEDCYNSHLELEYSYSYDNSITYPKEIEKIRKYERLKVKDIPQITHYENDKRHKVDVMKEYGLDFYKMWGITKKSKGQNGNNGNQDTIK